MSRSLRLSLFDAFFFSLMVGAGESYLPAYALSTGMSETLAGYFSAVPMIGGALVQLLTPMGVRYLGSVKKWVVSAVYVQALAFLPLIYFSFSSHPFTNHWVLFLVTIFYWGAGYSAGPVWNYWMGFLLPKDASSNFLAYRTKISQIGILIGLVGGGLALHSKFSLGPVTSVFSLLFLISFISRASSGLMLSLKEYKGEWFQHNEQYGLNKTFRVFWKDKPYQIFFTFLFFFNMAVTLSGPFVVPFFLAKLHFNYSQLMFALACLLVTKILALELAPYFTRVMSIRLIFSLGIIGISPLPAYWGVAQDFWFVILIQSLSGFFWGLFEFGLNVIFFQQLQHHNKISTLSLYNFFTATATVIGALIGGRILNSMNESMTGYFTIFIIGSLLRLTTVLVFFKKTSGGHKFL